MSIWKFRPGQQESKSLDAATSGNGKALPFADYEKVHWLIVGNGAVGAGTIIIESAHDPSYAGTWNPLSGGSPVTVVANAAVGGVADFPPGGWVRARVGTTVTGGTVTVYLNGVEVET